ncbi:MAG TPA: DnaJ family domain-containing protein [Pyrinomonadaceae bacterium]|jgi:DnaJ family protein C protein 28
MSKWEDLVEKKIRDAMKAGEFDNLPGKGRPLNLDENPFEDPSMRTAHRLLRNNGFTLPWIEERKEIDAAIDALRADLARSWARCAEAQTITRANARHTSEWEQAESAFRQQLVQLNRRINDFNLRAPAERFQRPALNAEREIDKITKGERGKGKG